MSVTAVVATDKQAQQGLAEFVKSVIKIAPIRDVDIEDRCGHVCAWHHQSSSLCRMRHFDTKDGLFFCRWMQVPALHQAPTH